MSWYFHHRRNVHTAYQHALATADAYSAIIPLPYRLLSDAYLVHALKTIRFECLNLNGDFLSGKRCPILSKTSRQSFWTKVSNRHFHQLLRPRRCARVHSTSSQSRLIGNTDYRASVTSFASQLSDYAETQSVDKYDPSPISTYSSGFHPQQTN